jgi:hypothetical protein
MVLCAMLRSRNWGPERVYSQHQRPTAKTVRTLVRVSPSLSLVLVKGDAIPGGGVSRPR